MLHTLLMVFVKILIKQYIKLIQIAFTSLRGCYSVISDRYIRLSNKHLMQR